MKIECEIKCKIQTVTASAQFLSFGYQQHFTARKIKSNRKRTESQVIVSKILC